ncbi:MAG: glycosyltransferase family 2 protein [Gemmatimonadaceae bacterium]|nr:glycosyltransferase family 2 protein [Gemmatimonadaceae bacterium]
MLYICIPVHNEAPTIGVLLWKIRAVFQEYSREYEILVYDDGSTDSTAETLAGYARALPLTVLGGSTRVGYAGALAALFQAASQRTRYARRDAVITLQGDFTDPPERIPEFVRRFEGGADIVVGEDNAAAGAHPAPIRRMRQLAPLALRAFVKTPGISDPFGTFRLYRVSVIRDALKAPGSTPLVQSIGWAANVDLLLSLVPHARRVESVPLEPRYDLRPRQTRIRPFADAWSLLRFSRAARARSLPALPARE